MDLDPDWHWAISSILLLLGLIGYFGAARWRHALPTETDEAELPTFSLTNPWTGAIVQSVWSITAVAGARESDPVSTTGGRKKAEPIGPRAEKSDFE